MGSCFSDGTMGCGDPEVGPPLVVSPTKARADVIAHKEISFRNDPLAATTHSCPRRHWGRNHQPGGGSERPEAVLAGSIAESDIIVLESLEGRDYRTLNIADCAAAGDFLSSGWRWRSRSMSPSEVTGAVFNGGASGSSLSFQEYCRCLG